MLLPDYIRDYLNSQVNNSSHTSLEDKHHKDVKTNVKLREISRARENLSNKYKNNKGFYKDKIIDSDIEIMAYILSRLPATFNVSMNVLSKYDFSDCKSLLDLGSGPGTVIFACIEYINSLEKITSVERENLFIQRFKQIISNSNIPVLQNTKIYNKDILDIDSIENHDLITCSYVLNELSENKQNDLINKIYKKSDKYIILIEPGTPIGYKNIINARTELIKAGCNIIAPCPHNNTCPLTHDDWCHFKQRLERTGYQRFLKNAQESYEDEKFSYLIASKKDITNSNFDERRIIRHPQIHKGHIDFKLCTNEGLKEITISKKDDNYKESKKKEWGELI